MPLDDPYATVADYRNRIKPTSDEKEDPYIEEDLRAMSRYLDRKLGRYFGRTLDEVERVYEVDSTLAIATIDDFAVAPSEILIDGRPDTDWSDSEELEVGMYDLLPAYSLVLPEPRPIEGVKLTNWVGALGLRNSTRVRVTGILGWPAVPIAIKSAVVNFTALYRLESPRATRRIPEVGESVETSPDAQRILKDLIEQYARHWYIR